MSTAERLSQLAIKDDGFLFDPTSGDTYVANPTALVVLRTLADGGDESLAVERLLAAYDVAEHEARRDAADLCARLKNWQLL
jgi:PqqD family protein of HPr-rel-A system